MKSSILAVYIDVSNGLASPPLRYFVPTSLLGLHICSLRSSTLPFSASSMFPMPDINPFAVPSTSLPYVPFFAILSLSYFVPSLVTLSSLHDVATFSLSLHKIHFARSASVQKRSQKEFRTGV